MLPPCVHITDFFTNYRPPQTPTSSNFPEPPSFSPVADSLFSSGILGPEPLPAPSIMTHLSGHNRLQVSSPHPYHAQLTCELALLWPCCVQAGCRNFLKARS